MMDKRENIIKSLVPAPSVIKRIYFIEDKKLKLSINKSHKGEEKSLKKIKIIFTKIIKICISVLIKNLIIFKTILFK